MEDTEEANGSKDKSRKENEERKEEETLLPLTNQEAEIEEIFPRRFHLYMSIFICKYLVFLFWLYMWFWP